jgi:hypothetical protein
MVLLAHVSAICCSCCGERSWAVAADGSRAAMTASWEWMAAKLSTRRSASSHTRLKTASWWLATGQWWPSTRRWHAYTPPLLAQNSILNKKFNFKPQIQKPVLRIHDILVWIRMRIHANG